MNTYNRLPVSFCRGEGVWLWGHNGKKYLDATSGYGVCGLGHCHHRITQKIISQSQKLIHVSNLFEIEEQVQLAEQLAEKSGLDYCYFCNSGAEANEAAIKLVRLYAREHDFTQSCILVLEKGFHGRTFGALSATDYPKIKNQFKPLLPDFKVIPINDLNAVRMYLSKKNQVVGILVESIQGVGGVRVLEKDYVTSLRKLCDEHNVLLIFDEVQTGIGRTGSFFSYQQYNIMPDIVTCAKGLANGLPIGVCLAKKSVARAFTPGAHGTTFGGGPLVTSVAREVLNTFDDLNLLSQIRENSNYLITELMGQLGSYDFVVDIRGMGFMIGIELSISAKSIVDIALKNCLLVTSVAGNVIRLLPPLIITRSDINFLLELLIKTFNEVRQSLCI